MFWKRCDFLIVSPRQIFGGGPIVLHLLCKKLRDRGYDARVLYMHPSDCVKITRLQSLFYHWLIPNINDVIKYCFLLLYSITGLKPFPRFIDYFKYSPIKGIRKQWLPWTSQETIVIYPEIFYGNVLNAKKVVRWLLYFNRYKNDSEAYGINDVFYSFRDIFNDKNLNPTGRKLKVSFFDYELYRQTNFGKRHGKCYVIRKGKDRIDLPKEFDGPILDSMPIAEIVQAFNRYESCYFYDTQTFLATIASICGCIPIIVMEPGKTKKDYLSDDDGERYGIAYGEVEIPYAIATRHRIMEIIHQREADNNRSVDAFIKDCETLFKQDGNA